MGGESCVTVVASRDWESRSVRDPTLPLTRGRNLVCWTGHRIWNENISVSENKTYKRGDGMSVERSYEFIRKRNVAVAFTPGDVRC